MKKSDTSFSAIDHFFLVPILAYAGQKENTLKGSLKIKLKLSHLDKKQIKIKLFR